MAQFFTPVTRINEKLKRADNHIEQLRREVKAFLGEAADAPVVYNDPQMREALQSFHQNRVMDLRISILTGEALYQIRSSLDHIVCALVESHNGTVTINTQFPIWLSKPTEARDIRRYEKQIAGITRPEARALIEEEQPYKRGDGCRNHWLAHLKRLNNADKHASLLLPVTEVTPRIRWDQRLTESGSSLSSAGVDDGTQPTESYIDVDGEFVEVVNVERSLAIDVAFDEWIAPGGIGRVSVVDGLGVMCGAVAGIVAGLAEYL